MDNNINNTNDLHAIGNYLISQGNIPALINLLLKTDTPISTSTRLLLADMLSENSDTDQQLICRSRRAQKGRPKKNGLEQTHEVNMGVEVWKLIDYGAKYEEAIRLISESHNAGVSKVEKAYSLAKRLNGK